MTRASTRDPGSEEPVRPRPDGRATLVDDDELQRLSAALGTDVGADEVDDETERGGAPQPAPFDIALPRPRAIDLRELWRLTKAKADPAVLAALGPNVPILLSHGMTAFPVAGRKPARVWGMGYDSSVFDVAADTVALAPATDMLDIARVGANAGVEVQLDGRLGVPEPIADALSLVPGVELNQASVRVKDDVRAAVFVQFHVAVARVVSGPDVNGGARWRLYSQDREIAGYQCLLQTLLVPKGTKSLRVDVKTWVREAGWFGPKNWANKTDSFEVPLDSHGSPARHLHD